MALWVLFTAAWLLWRQLPELRKIGLPGQTWAIAVLLAASIAFYIFGQAFDFWPNRRRGGDFTELWRCDILREVRRARCISQLVHLFLSSHSSQCHLPAYGLTSSHLPLKQLVSAAATSLSMCNLLVFLSFIEGVVIYVAQYQLLVEDACSGLNSIIGLLAKSACFIFTWSVEALGVMLRHFLRCARCAGRDYRQCLSHHHFDPLDLLRW